MRHIKQMEDIFAGLRDVVVPDDCWEPVEDNWRGDWIHFQKGHKVNLGRPTSKLQKQIARENALKRNINQKGANNRNAKTWRIVYADGREITIGGLQRWAVDNGYSASGIKNIAYGKWKKYRDLVSVTEVAQEAPTAP